MQHWQPESTRDISLSKQGQAGRIHLSKSDILLTLNLAAQKYKQGFHFVNCGADIVALTTSMSNEIRRVKELTQESATNGVKNDHKDGSIVEHKEILADAKDIKIY
jgi:hypothetical protein